MYKVENSDGHPIAQGDDSTYHGIDSGLFTNVNQLIDAKFAAWYDSADYAEHIARQSQARQTAAQIAEFAAPVSHAASLELSMPTDA